jgi:hypothetical protein
MEAEGPRDLCRSTHWYDGPIFSDDTPVLEAFIAEAEVTLGAPVAR